MEGKDKNSSVWKDVIKIPMFGRILSEFQCFEGQEKNSNIRKNGIRMPMFGRAG